MIQTDAGIGFAVPVATATAIADQLIATVEVELAVRPDRP